MLEASTKRFGEAMVGDNVLLAIPDLDRGRCEFSNLMMVGCTKWGRSGIIDSLYSRNQFSPTRESSLTRADINMDKTIPLRTVLYSIYIN